jgi:hypothetical protein
MTQSAAASKKPQRRYSERTLKILFAMSRNQCAHPDCTNPIIKAKTEFSGALVLGQIAHIYAASDDGPRGNSKLTDKERNGPDNLILLCPTHHVEVDGQHETYPATLLLQWKARHERRFREELGATIGDLGFAELEVAARALMTTAAGENGGDLRQIPPEQKIKKNGLGATSAFLLTVGAAKSAEVEAVLLKAAQLDPSFPDRLREGFVTKYIALRQELGGDELFLAMCDWAGGASTGKDREAAGLCILSHLFIICDVFEK